VTLRVGFALIAAVVAFVAWPLFPRATANAPAGTATPGTAADWERQKREAYSAIKDTEFDYRMGKLSEADFQALREKYVARALEAIAAIEQGKEARERSMSRRAVRILYCPECGRRVPARAKFCPGCGRSLRTAESAVA